MADWSNIEVAVIVADYFSMLSKELVGIPFNKSEHRRSILGMLQGRTGGAIEFKHQNISAALIKHGLPYIIGYKPMSHYQEELVDTEISNYLNGNPQVLPLFENFALQTINLPTKSDIYADWIVAPPRSDSDWLSEPKIEYKPIKGKNYIEIEQRNRSVGEAGEKLVLEFEKRKLIQAGVPELIKEIQWVSQDIGDGAGFDILSKKPSGEDIYIEVKSTTLGIDTPIYFSKTENDFSMQYEKQFHLYRVFNLKAQPKMFSLKGRFSNFCQPEPVQFKGYF